MDKLDQNQFRNVLEDVRKSYRLLALYQRRLIDIVKYVGNKYNQEFDSGWAKFSRAVGNGNRARIDALSWDWLNLYLYEFNMGQRKIGDDDYSFKIVHQADTGYYDKNKIEKINKADVEHYENASQSQSRLFFVFSKNENGCPLKHLLNAHLTSKSNGVLHNGNWIAVPYDLSRFMNQESTDKVLEEFNSVVLNYFNVEIMPAVEELSEDKIS